MALRRLLFATALLIFAATSAANAVVSCFAHTQLSAFSGNTPAIDTTGATLLVAVTGSYIYPTFISDSQSNLWYNTGNYGGTGGYSQTMISYVESPKTSATHTFTMTQHATSPSITIYACSGTLSKYALASTNGVLSPAGGTSLQTGSVTPVETGDLIMSGESCHDNTQPTATSINSGFSSPLINTTLEYNAAAFLVAPSGSAVNPTWTNNNSPVNCATEIAVFKADTATPPLRTQPYILTIAGQPTFQGYSGDGAAATSALLYWPGQLVLDAAGNLYFDDIDNNVVRVINRQSTTQTLMNVSVCSGCIQTVAGTGTLGNTGDGGACTSATMAHPVGLAIDSSGNLYIADQQNNRIRKCTTAGGMSTVVGSGAAGTCISGSFSGDGGAATSAVMFCPQGVAVDPSGNIYVADTNNSRVRGVCVGGSPCTMLGTTVCAGCIQTVAGSASTADTGDGGPATSAGLYWPLGVDLDSSGNLYICDYFHTRVRIVNSSGTINAFAGNGTSGYSGDGGSATSAKLNFPFDVKTDTSGNVFIADTFNSVIRKVNSGTITTIAGNFSLYGSQAQAVGGYSGDLGPATLAALAGNIGQGVGPVGIRPDNLGHIFIGDTNNMLVRELIVIPNVSGGVTFSGGMTVK